MLNLHIGERLFKYQLANKICLATNRLYLKLKIMNWIFQALPQRYPLSEKLVENHIEMWLVTRYKDEMKVGDKVYFWQAGKPDKRGIYGKGEIISEPKFYSDWGYGIKVKYTKRLNNHINVHTIKKQEKLKSHVIIKMPIGTNFKLSDSETSIIESIFQNQS